MKRFFGVRKDDNVKIYIEDPTWNCGWYWSFGYLGNRNEHYHLNSYQEKTQLLYDSDKKIKIVTEKRNKCMYDCLLADYDLNENIKNNLWKFCELAKTAYALKETAEVLGRGGSHYSPNPCELLIKNPEEVKRINEVVLPAIFKEIEKLIEGKQE